MACAPALYPLPWAPATRKPWAPPAWVPIVFIALTALSTHMPLLVLTVGSSSGRHLGAEVARAAHTPARTTPKPRRRVGARRSPRVTVAFADVEVGTASCRMHSAPSSGRCSKPYLND